MVVQDEQSIKKSTYICWSGLPNVFHHFTIGFLSNFPTYCSFLPLILSNSPTYFSTGSQQYFPMYFMCLASTFTFFLKQNILIIVLKQLSKTTKTGFQLSIHAMANTGNPKTLIVETTIGTNGVNLLQPLITQENQFWKILGPSKNDGKTGSDHIREILNPYEENLIMERNGDRRRLSKLDLHFFPYFCRIP